MVAATTERPVPVTNDPDGHAVLRAAHEAGYRFPEGFAGFAARLSYTHDGATAEGTTSVRAPREIEVGIEADEASLGWLRQEIASVAGHRWPTPYEQSDGRWTITLGPEDADPLGRQVLIHDDPFGSSYRIRAGRIAQVNRQMGPVRFSIQIQQHTELPDGRALPSAFTVAFWGTGENRLAKSDIYTDRYVEVSGVWLPASRRVITASDDGLTTRQFTLTEHTLLT